MFLFPDSVEIAAAARMARRVAVDGLQCAVVQRERRMDFVTEDWLRSAIDGAPARVDLTMVHGNAEFAVAQHAPSGGRI